MLPPGQEPRLAWCEKPYFCGLQGGNMLVLKRKSNQSIMIGHDIEVSVLAIMGEKVRIGIQAPRDVPVFRKEVYLEIKEERASEAKDARHEVDAALRGLGEDPPSA